MTSFLRRAVFATAAIVACTSAFAQAPEAPPGQPQGEGQTPAAGAKAGPAPNSQQMRPKIPEGTKPRPGKGERYETKGADGKQVVTLLHCALDPYVMLKFPTGNIEIIEASKAKATESPFAGATPEQMIEYYKGQGFSKYKYEQSKFYLWVYDCSDGFYAHSKSIMESMLPGVVASLKSFGLEVKRPETLMPVIVVPSREAFDKIHRMPPEVVAYYDVLKNHIVMYEDQELWEAAPEFAAKQACYTVAHEGVHQLLANIGIQNRMSHWSPWICEGLPEYYCPLRVNSNLIKKGNSELPTRTLKWNKAGMVNDLRMWSLLNMDGGTGQALHDLVSSEQIDADGYALAWGLVHFLATKKPDAFKAYLADLSKYQPLDMETRPLTGRPDALFVKHFGGDFSFLEREIGKYLNSKPMQAEYVDPIENQTHYVIRGVQKVGRTFHVQLAITTSPAAAKKFKEQEEALNEKATYTTKICKTRSEAEYQVRKLQAQ